MEVRSSDILFKVFIITYQANIPFTVSRWRYAEELKSYSPDIMVWTTQHMFSELSGGHVYARVTQHTVVVINAAS